MKDKPVVSLAQDLGRNATRLLCDEYCSEIVLSPLLDPLYIRSFPASASAAKDRLRFLYDRDRRDRLGKGLSKLRLIVIEDPPKNETGQNEPRSSAHLRYINYADLARFQSIDEHVHHLAARVV